MTKQEFADRIVGMQGTLYRVSTSLLPALCDREDAVQEALRRAWQSREKLRDDGAFRSWMIRILINECYAILRGRKREFPAERLPEWELLPDADLGLFERVAALDEKYRLPLMLHYVEGYGVAEVARMLRLPQGTVKSRLHRGRLLLKDTLATAEEVRL